MAGFFGWINAILLAVILSPFCINRVARYVPAFGKKIAPLRKPLRVVHKVAAVLLLVLIVVHGYLALGGFRLHTGTVLGLCATATVLLGLLFFLLKKPVVFKIHKLFALLTVLAFLLHMFFRNLL